MPPQLEYPDLVPPKDWTYFRAGPQVRLIPPGTTAQTATVTIIVSPVVPRLPQMPAVPQLIEMAIEAEARVQFEITAKTGPTPISTTTGLDGVFYDVSGYARPANPMERRIYVMYSDDKFLYGISYLTSPAAFDDHAATFWAVAKSIKPFTGRPAPAGAPPPLPGYEE